MFNVFKRLPSGEMVLTGAYDSLNLAELAAETEAVELSCVMQIEAETAGGSRIVSVFDMRSREVE